MSEPVWGYSPVLRHVKKMKIKIKMDCLLPFLEKCFFYWLFSQLCNIVATTVASLLRHILTQLATSFWKEKNYCQKHWGTLFLSLPPPPFFPPKEGLLVAWFQYIGWYCKSGYTKLDQGHHKNRPESETIHPALVSMSLTFKLLLQTILLISSYFLVW